VQHGGDGQVLAPHGAVDDDLQPAEGGKGVDGAPVAAGAVVVQDEHQATSSAAVEAATARARPVTAVPPRAAAFRSTAFGRALGTPSCP
jgi:hypothetical protein